MAGNNVLAKMAVYLDANTAAFNAKLTQSDQILLRLQNGAQAAGGAIAATFGAYQIFNGLKAGIQIIAEFEAQMSEVKAITGATGSEFDALRDNALSLGAASKFTAAEIGKLQTEFARLGFTTNEILAATKATVDLATATGEDLAKSTVTVGSAIRQFNLPAKEAGHLADVMAGAFNQTALALDDFQEAMKYVGPAAAAANLNFEQTSALLGILADNGIKGSQAGTSLRRILVDLAKDGRPLSERLDELSKKGITLANATDDVGRIASTALIVLEKGAGRIDPLSQSFANLHGEAARVAAVMRDNLQGDTDRATAAFNNLILTLSGVTAVLRPIVQEITGIFTALTSDNLTRFEKFAAILASLGTLSADPLRLLAGANNIINAQEEKLDKTARATFIQFANGFKSTSEAAEIFKQKQYELILAAQIQKAQNDKLFASDKTERDAINAGVLAEIAGRERLIKIASEYIRATAPTTGGAAEIHRRTIEVIENEIKALKDNQGQVESGNVGAYRSLEKQIAKLNLEIVNTEIGFNKVKQAAALAAAEVVKVNIPKKFSVDKIDTSSVPGIGSAEAINVITKSLDDLKKKNAEAADDAEKQFARIQKASKKLALDFSHLFVGIGEAIGNAISGVGNFGDNLLQALGAFVKQFGTLIIATATASIIFQESLFDSPWVALAAGIALVAAGTAVANLAKAGPSASPSAATSTRNAGNYSQLTTSQVEITGSVKLAGQDMFITLTNYQNNKNG